MGLMLQYAVIALLALISLAVVMRKQFPGSTRRLRTALALPLLREERARWLRAIGRWIAPPASMRAGSCGGCSSGCDSAPSQRRHR